MPDPMPPLTDAEIASYIDLFDGTESVLGRMGRELLAARAELAACREALRPLAAVGTELIRQNGAVAEALYAYVPGHLLTAVARLEDQPHA